jgi:hypothetical protein
MEKIATSAREYGLDSEVRPFTHNRPLSHFASDLSMYRSRTMAQAAILSFPLFIYIVQCNIVGSRE